MKKSSLTVTGTRFSARVILPAEYEFSQAEIIYLGGNEIEFLRRNKNPVIFCNIPEKVLDTPKVKGLASRFAGLKTIQDINLFAGEYGLLGLNSDLHPGSVYDFPEYGNAWYEGLGMWGFHIITVRRLMKLYRALSKLKKGYDVDINELLHLEERIELSTRQTFFRITWHDGIDTGSTLDNYENIGDRAPNEETAAIAVLSGTLKRILKGGINMDFSKIVPAKNAAIGFRIAETRTTPYLLAAIYYDLWEMITENRPVEVCVHCGLPLERTGRRKFCDDACKQAAYRNRLAKQKGQH